MCTAYEIGQVDDWDVDWLVADAFESSMFEDGTYQIVRPTLAAPVMMPDDTWRTMSWGFRRPVPGASGKQLWRTIVNSREGWESIACREEAGKGPKGTLTRSDPRIMAKARHPFR